MSAYEFIIRSRMSADDTGEVEIGGAISEYKWDESDVTAADFKKAIDAVKGAKRLNVRINSGGGSVFQAVAMKQMIEGHKATDKHVYIDGICASAATIPACADGAKVHMARGAMYMIHNPMTWAAGDYNEMLKTADTLDKMSAEFAGIYARRTGAEIEDIRAQMDAETWFTSDGAVESGFADDITGEEAVACADISALSALYHNAPDIEMAARTTEDRPGDAGQPDRTNINEVNDMEWQDITMEQLRAERGDLVEQIIAEATQSERARMRAIDEAAGLTDEMADDAKYVNPVDAGVYALNALKAQRKKGAEYMEARAQETAQLREVKPDAAPQTTKDDTDELAKMLAGLVKEAK